MVIDTIEDIIHQGVITQIKDIIDTITTTIIIIDMVITLITIVIVVASIIEIPTTAIKGLTYYKKSVYWFS